jgi:hypothetical protein
MQIARGRFAVHGPVLSVLQRQSAEIIYHGNDASECCWSGWNYVFDAILADLAQSNKSETGRAEDLATMLNYAK